MKLNESDKIQLGLMFMEANRASRSNELLLPSYLNQSGHFPLLIFEWEREIHEFLISRGYTAGEGEYDFDKDSSLKYLESILKDMNFRVSTTPESDLEFARIYFSYGS